MTSTFLTFALLVLAPTMAYAAAFPNQIPGPTPFFASVDSWSPAPTAAPQLSFDVLKRGQAQGSNTCGFDVGVPGKSFPVHNLSYLEIRKEEREINTYGGTNIKPGSVGSAITCAQPSALCATNSYFGVLGCCNPSSISACIIPTTCIPYTALPTTSSSSTSSSNEDIAITRCTEPERGECYEYLILYDRTNITQHGCAASAFTSTAFHSLGMSLSSSVGKETVTVTREPVTTPTSSSVDEGEGSKPSLGAIVGGTIGACVFVSFCGFVCFLAWRRRKAHSAHPPYSATQQQGVIEYNPLGFPSPGFSSPGFPSPELSSPGFAYMNEQKTWQQHRSIPQYPGMGQIDIAEVDGRQGAVEAPCNEKLGVAEVDGRGK
jgi:hypothetical protein